MIDKKQAIEEMQKDLIEIFGEEYEKRRLITPQNTAEKMTAKGYRKQIEGEWIEHETAWGDVFYSCSVCGDERCAVDGSIWELGLNFCPNCGARMKGGAE